MATLASPPIIPLRAGASRRLTIDVGLIGWAAILGLLSLLLAWATGGISASFVDPDEPAHYVSTLFIADWLRAGLPSPMHFATDYYLHFPKLAIGHWPPGWYALLAPLYAVWRPSPYEASLLAAFVSGLPAMLVAWALIRAAVPRAIATAASAAMLVLPLVAHDARFVLLDQPTALVVGLAAMAWLDATARRTLLSYLLFAVLAVFATLVKGNGALIALVPAFDILFARRWRQLGEPKLWVAAIVAVLLAAPWYYVSFKIAAGGFNYQAGTAYAWLSLRSNAAAILATLGIGGTALALLGAVVGWRQPLRAPMTRLAVAVMLATLVFQAAVPVAVEPRYILPAVPWLVVLATLALMRIARMGASAGRAVALLLAAVVIVPAAWAAGRQPPKADIGAPGIAALAARHPGIWLIDGRAGDEGAVIAAMAYADDGRMTLWAARASQWLSTSDFMGNDYRLTVTDPAGARGVFDRLGVVGTVSIERTHRPAYPHSVLLQAATRAPDFGVARREFARGDGAFVVAVRAAPALPHPERLAGASANIAAMGIAD